MDVTGNDRSFKEKYVSFFAQLTATKVFYEGREYIVVHAGVDYGD
jgi:hypothetical protein